MTRKNMPKKNINISTGKQYCFKWGHFLQRCVYLPLTPEYRNIPTPVWK